ncbi:putative transcriptional regulator, LysR family protein [Nocardia neocaledoniensis NBRC 108232]|uniref:DNA-binding transcriptional LysR family regulator n=1 Tax=Nocardia neocaledoniensis TaxID=236511 RepID=A0A317N501_9NOCA|nr:LysR family transcriptional regulator [Nocardia neocaledoniensis]PWV70346.1 DNA-binding transcriptional LysR family regulator [Nocardia neocaledoniensis]GEM33404.1 putative transcriptional regulator, LysR family protein [Nocardia neocaledoniensis NBRC 108232]
MDENADAQALAPLLAAFDAAAEEGHFTRAAQRLGVPQSSLSRRIKTIEQTLGVALFQPVGRGVTLTPQGRELYAHTRGLVRALDDAVRRVRADADPDSGLVRFGFPLTLGPVSIPTLLAQFHTGAPRIRLHLVQAHGEALADQVRAGALDLAVMIPPPTDLPTVPLGRQRIDLHVARTHPLAGRTRIDLADLAGESFIANPPSYQLRSLLDTWCAAAGFTPRVAFEITEFETLRELVALGLGVALLPAAEQPHPDLAVVPIDGERDREIGLVSGDHRPTLAVARLRDFLIARAARIRVS